MLYRGVLFDLFGTLVLPFRRREHEEVLRQCANVLGLAFEDCHRVSGDLYSGRIRGKYASISENFAQICSLLHHKVDAEKLAKAEAIYEQFTLSGLEPKPGALDVLSELKSRGTRLALVTNCAPDVPHVWEQTAFAPYFDYCAFSCRLGVIKPEPLIYQYAIEALKIAARDLVYVGDGSDEELTGAARCGLTPILISVDLSNTYDNKRKNVDEWDGPTVHSLEELLND